MERQPSAGTAGIRRRIALTTRQTSLVLRSGRRCLAGLCLLAVAGVAGHAHAQTGLPPNQVEPMEPWLEFEERPVTGEVVELHLRAGYERPVIFPEAVRRHDDASLPGTSIDIDQEVVLFSPGQRYAAQEISFVGLVSARIYRMRVSSSPLGDRMPLRLRWQ